ncbi:hypothetical protein WOLCODRAFT_137202 [Wolfiporia cocos MD-104 SS10]|uniref:Uncharacterized protein n=1 Tax=Wolfiporia cocos (strain MD-104) TaxID=742152 RepID=A0A2H3JHU0_WOLCO|nr:hypothetical protein WOLCODRAFT_137202 [Wolfiporia cocos MD-104 SS10]
MDLPSAREIELETLLRQRDEQLAELTDEVTQLRQYLSNQPAPSTTDPFTLPPALVSLLLPHLNDRSSPATAASNTVTAALTQRAKILQEENDELYELLKSGETGKLKEDVHALRRVVQKLEGALKESHQVIASLSAELDRSQEALITANSRQQAAPKPPPGHSQSPVPRNMYQQPPHLSSANGATKLPPTGPRAHKKPRLSESHTPPAPPSRSMYPNRPSNTHSNPSSLADGRGPEDRKPFVKMDADDDERTRPRSPERERERDRMRDRDRERERERDRDRERPRERERDRDRERERNRERERERDRASRRNGAHGGGRGGNGGSGGGGGGGGRRGARGATNAYNDSGDRTLAERLGL